MRKPLLAALLLGTLLAAQTAAAAPIEIAVRLEPAQSGPVFSWSLRITVQPGYDVGGVALLTTGFSAFTPDPANPGIGVLDSVYTIDPLGDGRNALILNNYADGISIAPGGSANVLLGTFFGPHQSAPPVIVENCEFECGYTAVDPFLQRYLAGAVSLTTVPEPAAALPAILALVALGALRTARRRAA